MSEQTTVLDFPANRQDSFFLLVVGDSVIKRNREGLSVFLKVTLLSLSYITADEASAIADIGNNELPFISIAQQTNQIQLYQNRTCTSANVAKSAVVLDIGVPGILKRVSHFDCRRDAIMTTHQQKLDEKSRRQQPARFE